MKKKKVYIHFQGIDDFICCSEGYAVAGMVVQLTCWANIFKKNGWDVYTGTIHKSRQIDGINFLRWNISHKFEILLEPLRIFRILLTTRPDVIILNGADRNLLYADILCRMLGIRLLFIAASDKDFSTEPGFIAGGMHNTKMYWYALRKGKYSAIVQNAEQQRDLKINFGHDSIIVPNVWCDINFQKMEDNAIDAYDFVWVANIKSLKRPEWFIQLAKNLPQYTFAMAGGKAFGDNGYYDKIKAEADNVSNLTFLGPLSFQASSKLIASAKALVCTSEFEGLPNTFMQAWQTGTPIISAVNPSSVITSNNLGYIAEDIAAFCKYVEALASNTCHYGNLRKSVIHFYNTTYRDVDLISIINNLL